MNLKSFMLKERRQTQETPYCIISFTENLDKAKPNYSDETKHDCFSQSLSHRGSASEILLSSFRWRHIFCKSGFLVIVMVERKCPVKVIRASN